ncbi:MAG: conjugal transfer protein [Alkaliphilus sp.]
MKVKKLNTIVFQKVGRVILWTLIIFLLIRGVGTFFGGNEMAKVEERIDFFINSTNEREKVLIGAKAFAENFAYAFFNTSNQNYNESLRRFVSSHVALPRQIQRDAGMYVERANAFEVEWISENKLNVHVLVNLKYEVHEDDTELAQNLERTVDSEITVVVPVISDEGTFVSDGLPFVVASREKALVEFQTLNFSRVDNEKNRELTKILTDFFEVYYEGSSGALRFFMYDKQVDALEGRFELERITSVSGYVVGEEEILALVDLQIRDSISGVVFLQSFEVLLVLRNDLYQIKDFGLRIFK